VFKAVKNRKRSGYVDCQQVRSIHRNLFFSKLQETKATHFETMMTTVDEVNSDKTKVQDEFIARSVLLDCFTARWVNWLTIDVSLHVSVLLKLYGCIRVCKRTIGSLFLRLSPLFSVVHQLRNYTKTIFRLGLGEYCQTRRY